jgi:hypothetical protein
LAAQAAVGSVEIIEILALLELLVEQPGVVDDDTVEHSVGLLIGDPMTSLNLAVQPWGGRLDVDVADPSVQQVPME